MDCVFSQINFNAATIQIQKIRDMIIELKEVFNSHTNQQEGNYSINATITYITYLLKSIVQLETISKNLTLKASGKGKYGFFAYRKDFKKYKELEKIRESFGNQLNSALERSW